ncbi:MAG: hypothetical protein AAF919_02120 [Pseudomonadota bacterium]
MISTVKRTDLSLPGRVAWRKARAIGSTVFALILMPLAAIAEDDVDAFVRGMTNGLLQTCKAECAEGDASCAANCDCLGETLPERLDVSEIATVPADQRTRETAIAFARSNQSQIVTAMQECGVIQGDG